MKFPDEYPVETMKGKPARFDVKVKEVAKPVKPAVDDEFAKSLGADDLAKLREMVAAQIKREYDQVSRNKLKRQLLDALDKAHDFELPPSLVDAEFNPDLGGIILEGIGKRVTILGVNLQGLYELIIDHEIGEVIERHEPEHLMADVAKRGEAYVRELMWERL